MITTPKIIIVSGPSGCGKGTLIRKYLESHPEVYYAISDTTRKPREGEIDGVDYNFISNKEFKKRLKNKEYLEYAKIHKSYFYGTHKNQVLNALESGKIVLLEIDYQGFLQIKDKFPKGVIKSIFIMPFEKEILQKLIRERSKISEDELKKRMESVEKEVKVSEDFYDIRISPVYGDIEKSYEIFKKVVENIDLDYRTY